MSRIVRITILMVIALYARLGFSFEPETHAEISVRAVQKSVLSQQSVLSDMGLQSSILDDSQQFPNGRARNRNIVELFQDGARFEDDFLRSLNHFYNPLTGAGIRDSSPSPDWAISGAGDTSTTKFSFNAAREYMYNALTDGSESFRLRQFGLMFRSLGQVIHHIQDMAQPQHTRLDLHCAIEACKVIGKFAPSAYEIYTDKDGIRDKLLFLGYDPTYGQDDIQTFNSARKFWQTPDGKGMADYSNRGFVSAGTNFDKPGLFPSPVFDPTAVSDPQDIQVLCAEEATRGRPCENTNLTGTITFYGSAVEDRFRPSTNTFNFRTSSHSIFDPDLKKEGRASVFSLNRFNFYAAHDLLIPRAVGYSAGLINYFFRGKLDFKKDEQDQTKFRIVNLGPEAMNGRFALYYDAKDGNRYPVTVDPADPNRDIKDSKGWLLTVAALNPVVPNSNLSEPIAFVPPVDDGSPTSPKARNEYMLVFSGTMGEEQEDKTKGVLGAVVAKAIKAEYNGVLYVRVTSNERGTSTLRVDKGGTRYVESGEFDPFFSVEIRQNDLPSYAMKQVVFTRDAFGEPVHRTIALAAGFFGISFPRSYALDGPNGFRLINAAGVSWLAKSPDPQVGEFVLGTVPFQRSFLELQYTRTFQENGLTQVATGKIPLPSRPVFPQQDNMDGGSRFFISGDGLTYTSGGLGLSGVWPDSTPLVTARAVDFRFSLSAVPTAALVLSDPEPFGVFQRTNQNVNEVIGTFSVTPPAGRCAQWPVTQPSTFDNRHTLTEEIISQYTTARRLVEYQNGVLLSYTNATRFRITSREEVFGGIFGVGDCPGDTWMFADLRGDRTNTQEITQEGLLSSGGVLASARTFRPSSLNSSFNHTIRALYEGPSSGAPNPLQQIQEKGVVESNTGIRVARALTDRPEDAIVLTNAFASRWMFRGVDLQNRRFAADASPLGEVFFATEDKANIVHEPKPGGMPVIQLPPDVSTILSAIWL